MMNADQNDMPKHKRVFISYAWEDADYKAWVKKFATQLREWGVDARLDQWHIDAGDNIPGFMNSEIRHADFVLILCSPIYREKVHAQEDKKTVTGSGWESRLVSSKIFGQAGFNPIPVLARGSWEESAPDFMSSQYGFDLTDPNTYADEFNRLVEEITGTKEKAPPLGELMRPEATRAPVGTPGAEPALVFHIRGIAPCKYQVELLHDGQPTASGQFDLDLDLDESQLPPKLQQVRESNCTADDINHLGGELWDRLKEGGVRDQVAIALANAQKSGDQIVKVQLIIPPELEDIPWESLWDYNAKSIATSPEISLSRGLEKSSLPTETFAPKEPGGPLRMLVVIPEGSGLVTSAEWEKIQQITHFSDHDIELDSLAGEVSPNDLAEKLKENWDIVHFIGHGKIGAHGSVEIRFNCDIDAPDCRNGENWLPADLFAQMFRLKPPRLVVLNCCHGAAPDEKSSAGLGTQLLQAKVPAAVLMQYQVDDSVAAKFAGFFYQEFFNGERAGRVDFAMQMGRVGLSRTYTTGDHIRAFITPVLYLREGCHQLFKLEQATEPKTSAGGEIDKRIDPRLIAAVERGICLPIIGPDVLAAGAVRSESIPPGPGGLAQTLARKSGFPGYEEVGPFSETAGPWLTPILLERVCQHFESVQSGERAELNETVTEIYRGQEAPAIFEQFGSWKVPGLLYTYIDGLLETVLQKVWGSNLRIIQSDEVDSPLSPGKDTVLLNLRGTYTDPGRMILTEDDNDRILDERIKHIAGSVENLMNNVGACTLLFLGVSPRDALVRALSRRVLRHSVSGRRGTAFFVSNQMNNADKFYWCQLPKIEVLDIDFGTLINGLTIAANRSARDDQ